MIPSVVGVVLDVMDELDDAARGMFRERPLQLVDEELLASARGERPKSASARKTSGTKESSAKYATIAARCVPRSAKNFLQSWLNPIPTDGVCTLALLASRAWRRHTPSRIFSRVSRRSKRRRSSAPTTSRSARSASRIGPQPRRYARVGRSSKTQAALRGVGEATQVHASLDGGEVFVVGKRAGRRSSPSPRRASRPASSSTISSGASRLSSRRRGQAVRRRTSEARRSCDGGVRRRRDRGRRRV